MSEVGFEKRKLNRSVNADEAVARGAAIFASQIAQNSKVSLIYFVFVFENKNDTILLDYFI